MTFYKLLYNRLLPTLFRMQDHTDWFIWVPILGDVVRIKERAIDYLKLQKGNNVLVYSVGAGYELDFIVDKVGKEGSIVGVDFSEGMLKIAREKIQKNNWTNVKLVLADVREYNPLNDTGHTFDAALSNFGYLDERVLCVIRLLFPFDRIIRFIILNLRFHLPYESLLWRLQLFKLKTSMRSYLIIP